MNISSRHALLAWPKYFCLTLLVLGVLFSFPGTAADDLALDAQALHKILYPHEPLTSERLQTCAHLLQFGSFRNKVQAFTASPAEIIKHGRKAYVVQELEDGTWQTDIPWNGNDLFVDLKIDFQTTQNAIAQKLFPTQANPGLNNPAFGWFYQPRQGLFPPGTELFLTLWPGAGGGISHAGSVIPVMRALINPKVKSYQKTMLTINRDGLGKFVPAQISAEAFDFPFCGNHCDTFSPHQANLAQTLANLAAYFELRHQQAIAALGHDIPFVVLARSANAAVITAFNQAYPGLVNGQILIGPTAPGLGADDLGYQDSLNHLIEEIQNGQSKPNYNSIIYTDTIFQQMASWKSLDDPFSGVDTLVLVGENDLETPGTLLRDGRLVPTKLRAWLLENAEDNLPHLYFLLIPKGPHNVFARLKDQDHYDNITPLAHVQLFLKALTEDFRPPQIQPNTLNNNYQPHTAQP